jgi:tRNA (guanine37-N1)-methyltransferase
MSGHHGEIEKWRKAQSEEITRARRPDMWARYQEMRTGSSEKS